MFLIIRVTKVFSFLGMESNEDVFEQKKIAEIVPKGCIISRL